jgi:prefoldin subunit 5
MAEKKHKRESSGFIELDSEELGFVLEPTQVEVGSGYAVSVSYDEDEKPIIDVKIYGEVNITQLRKEIEKLFPNAQIRQLNQTQTVTIVKKRKRKPNTKKK